MIVKKIHIALIGMLFLGLSSVRSQTTAISDDNFRLALQEVLPVNFFEGDLLKIPEAQGFMGGLDLTNKNISDVSEIVHFHNIGFLILKDNNLTTLPSLETLSTLTYFEFSGNNLSEFPDLDENLALKKIVAVGSNLTSVPVLTNAQLTMLNLTANPIAQVGSLDALVNLDSIYFSGFTFKEFPSMLALENLRTLVAWGGALNTFPDLSGNDSLRLVALDQNELHEISDLSSLMQLETLNVFDNMLSPNEILIAKTQLPVSVNVNFGGQNASELSSPNQIRVTEALGLSYPVGESHPSDTFEWFRNGVSIHTGSTGSYSFVVGESDTGYYHVELSNSGLSGYLSVSDSILVNVNACLEVDGSQVSIGTFNCATGNEVQVSDAVQGTASPRYFELQSPEGAILLINESGVFSGLYESTYQWKVTNDDGCEVESIGVVLPESKPCEDFVLTPDGDGKNDEVHFDGFEGGGVFDSDGNQIFTLDDSATWAGQSSSGTVLPGLYFVFDKASKQRVTVTIID